MSRSNQADNKKLFNNNCRFLPPQIIDFLSLCKSEKFYTTITTNGQALNKSTILQLYNTGAVNEISVSVDSVDKKVFEQIRQGLDYNIVTNNIKILKELFNNLTIEVVELPENEGEHDRIRKFFSGINVIFNKDKRINKGFGKNYVCAKIDHSLTICADGSVLKCCFDYKTDSYVGNISESSLRDIWLSDKNFDFLLKNKENRLSEIPICRQICIRGSSFPNRIHTSPEP